MNNEHDLTKGNLWKQILLFSLPLMASNILQVLFNISDIAVVGKFSGDQALGAVGSTTIMVSLFTGFLIGIGNGVNVLIAKLIGKKDEEGLKKAIFTSFITSLSIGLIVLIAGLIFIRPLLELIKTKDDLIDGATLYLKIYILGMPGVAIYNFGNGVLSANGDTKKPIIFLTIAGILNVILNLFFVIVCKMSVDGVAIASIISQYTSAFLIVICLIKTKSVINLGFNFKNFKLTYTSQVLKLGIPSGFQNSIFAIANLFIQSAVNSFDTLMVDGNSAAANFDALVYDIMAAFYMATSSFGGQNYGANNKKRVLDSYLISTLYAFLFGLVIGVSLVLFGRFFLSIFTSSPDVIERGMKRLRIMGFSYAFSALMDASIAASRGISKTVVPTIIVIMGSCVFRVVWIYTIFEHYHTIESLYLLYIFSWMITGIVELIYFVFAYKSTFKSPPISKSYN